MEKERSLKRAKAERAAKQKKARKRKRVIFLLAEIIIFILLLGMWYVIAKYGKLQVNLWGKDDIVTNEGVNSKDYKTIAVFGVDSKDGTLDKGTHSDTMIVISIHKNTKEVKLVSVYQNLLTMQMDDTIKTAKEAYYIGGPKEAVNMLNRNLDLAITDYITLDYTAVVNLVDSLGGIEWTITEAEAKEMNLHILETATLTGQTAGEVKSGLQIMDGVKTLTYMRICNNVGGDISRTGRQALVIRRVLEQVKKADIATIDRIANQTFTQIATSLTLKDFLSLISDAMHCKLVDAKSYAFEYKEASIKGFKNAVIPLGVKENVGELHAFLYGKTDYKVTQMIQKISEETELLSGYSREDYEGAE